MHFFLNFFQKIVDGRRTNPFKAQNITTAFQKTSKSIYYLKKCTKNDLKTNSYKRQHI